MTSTSDSSKQIQVDFGRLSNKPHSLHNPPAMISKKPVRMSLARQVLNAMEHDIRVGLWQVGDRIPPEPELSKLFSVSHNTVREAVQSLIHAGMLEARPGDGTYVMANDRFAVAMNNRLNEAELSKILEARLALEKEIARLAATNRTQDDLKKLEHALAQCSTRCHDGITDDMQFHATVAEATHNPVLAELYGIIIRHLMTHLEMLLVEKQYDEAAIQLHVELTQAIRNSNADQAQEIIIKIIEFDTQSILHP
ncbi:MAG: FadR/GntR family transcriptional regulator [Akkermansia sp.]